MAFYGPGDMDHDIDSALDLAADSLASEDAAIGHSYVGDRLVMEIEETVGPADVVGVAYIGDAVAVNGEILVSGLGEPLHGVARKGRPENWLEEEGYAEAGYGGIVSSEEAELPDAGYGGIVYSEEAELPIELIVNRACMILKQGHHRVSISRVGRAAIEKFGDVEYVYWGSGSGSAEVWVRPHVAMNPGPFRSRADIKKAYGGKALWQDAAGLIGVKNSDMGVYDWYSFDGKVYRQSGSTENRGEAFKLSKEEKRGS